MSDLRGLRVRGERITGKLNYDFSEKEVGVSPAISPSHPFYREMYVVDVQRQDGRYLDKSELDVLGNELGEVLRDVLQGAIVPPSAFSEIIE